VIGLDLRSEGGQDLARRLARDADVLVEGFRPGVMERLGLGPELLLADNPKLVYGRMTGWGQDGPLAQAAGHDINYIAISGVLGTVGRAGEKPVPPINYARAFGRGGKLRAFGLAAALVAVQRGGPGQVVDAAMTEGSSLLAGMLRWLGATGRWQEERGVNLLDGGAHFYDSYETADGKYVAIGAIEPQFYALLLDRLGLSDDPAFRAQLNPAAWPILKTRLADIFRTKTRDQWCALMEGTDICFAPVLSLAEAPLHPHNVARKAFVEVGGMVQPAPAPRYSATPSDKPRPPGKAGADNDALLGR
jgi:alpha-methylacyl-CoA racemase